MSLARLALRLATIEALRPTAAVLAGMGFPTIAGIQVLDSSVEPIEDLKPDQAQPIIGVYTEHDDGMAGQKRGGPPFLSTVDLVFEISVVVKVASGSDPTVFVVADPETDSELEASLDLLEAQIKFVLLYGPTGQIWQSIAHNKVHSPRSVPHRSSEEGRRLAKRTMTWRVEVQDYCFDPAPVVAPTGFDVFPEPLKSFANALPPGSYALTILNGLAAEPTAPVMPTATPLETAVLNVAIRDPANNTLPATPQITSEVDDLKSED
jgi:hypothetical protein